MTKGANDDIGSTLESITDGRNLDNSVKIGYNPG